jgi:hypothetical protein
LHAGAPFQVFVSFFACLLSCPRIVFRKRLHLGGHLYEAVHMFLAAPCWLPPFCCSSLLTMPACLLPAGLSSVSLSTSMQGAMARVRAPFTPSQWIELEHQALIYKYLAANSPIPHSLLIPIRRSLAASPYPPSYFGTSTCKPRKSGEPSAKAKRPRVCFLG